MARQYLPALWLLILYMRCMDQYWCSARASENDRNCSCGTGCNFNTLCFKTDECQKVNVALGKPAEMSSTYQDASEPSGPACVAVNGNAGTTYVPALGGESPNCIHTDVDDCTAWWQVDLGRNYTVSNITVYIRKNQIGRMNNVTITVDDEVCFVFTRGVQYEAGPKKNLKCRRPLVGRSVKFSKQSSSDCLLNFCEVQVWGCADGYFGTDCDQRCGNCAENMTCDPTTGDCLSGCKEGWQGSMCNECKSGLYGELCSMSCGNCKDGVHCNVSNGACPGECENGFELPTCKETCANKMYGINCSLPCGNCKNSSACNPFNGTCDECEENFQRNSCTDCLPGRWGELCEKLCVNCSGNECHRFKGICTQDCIPGEVCTTPSSRIRSQTDVTTAVIVGAVVGPVIVIAVIIFIIVLILRRQLYVYEDNKDEDGQNSGVSPIYPCAAINPMAMTTTKEITEDRVPGSVYENVLRHTSTNFNDRPVDSCMSAAFEADEWEDELTSEDTKQLYGDEAAIYATFGESIQTLDTIQRHLVDKLASGSLLDEFKKLRRDIQESHFTALEPHNFKKNRYRTIVPYDFNRVVLTDGYEEGGSNDYVNASFVKGFQSSAKYIASQGPRENTVTDFWRMVWQERIRHIVMTTSLWEGGKNKCYEYWPATNTTQTYGPIKVTGLDVQRKACFIIRTFAITSADGVNHTTTQYHFTAWSDHGVPSVTSLVDFWRYVRSRSERESHCPLLVHCSAGIGRTGTYIGLDIAMDSALKEGEINLPDIVNKMRDDRMLMVQAPEQYLFLHMALLEAYTGRNTKLSVEHFDAIFSQPIRAFSPQPRIDNEFKRVMQMRSLTAEQSNNVANTVENVDKNRKDALLPSDGHLVSLTENMSGRNQYINAVFVSTFTQCGGIIITQLPLPSTLVDFWRLVFGKDVSTIVSLGSSSDESKLKNFCRFWPENTDTIQTGPYNMTLKSVSRLGQHIDMYTVNIGKQGSSTRREVHIIRYNGWNYEVPDKTDLFQLLEILDAEPINRGSNPAIIQCTDGGTKSGLLCTIRDIISRVTCDREVDVYMTVRHLQSVQPEAITTVEQYRYCYEVAQHKVRDLSIYSNA